MTHLSQPTCKRLEEMGLTVPGDGKLWYRNAGKYTLLDDTFEEYGYKPFVDKTTLAYTHLDIIGNKENAVRAFGDELKHTGLYENMGTSTLPFSDKKANGYCGVRKPLYKISCHLLLETLLTDWDFEDELIKLME